MNEQTTRWMTEYLDEFDNHCEGTNCENCPIHPLHEKDKAKSCFRIFCEMKDAKKKLSAGKSS